MFRLNFTIPTLVGLSYFLDDKYKPDAMKSIEKGFQKTEGPHYVGLWRMRKDDQKAYEEKFHKAERQKNVEELASTAGRLALALGIHQIANQLKKLPFFLSRPLLADCICLSAQSTLSVPSTLFSLAYKTYIHPVALVPAKNIPEFYVKEFRTYQTPNGEKKYFQFMHEPHMSQYFSHKFKCRPVLFLTGFVTSLFLLSSTARTHLQWDNKDIGLLEGLFPKAAKIKDLFGSKSKG